MAERFLVGRACLDETPNDPLRCDTAQASGVVADDRNFEQLGETIDSALDEGKWPVLVAHEARPQAMTTNVLKEVRRHVSRIPELWTDTVSRIGAHLLQERGG